MKPPRDDPGHVPEFHPAKPSDAPHGPDFDMAGNKIERGDPDPNAPGDAEKADIARAKAYTWHKNAGTLPVFYDQFGGAPAGYSSEMEPTKSRSRGR